MLAIALTDDWEPCEATRVSWLVDATGVLGEDPTIPPCIKGLPSPASVPDEASTGESFAEVEGVETSGEKKHVSYRHPVVLWSIILTSYSGLTSLPRGLGTNRFNGRLSRSICFRCCVTRHGGF